MKSQKDHLTGTIRQLRSSPLFQLSLASKELFHSNFLAWLGETYEDQIGQLFSAYLPNQPTAFAPLEIKREEKNLDLVIRYPGGQQLVIENKVKSLPREEQLKEYAAVVKKKHQTGFLLLSLARPDFLKDGATAIQLDDGAKWHCLSYSDLIGRLDQLSTDVASCDSYHGALLADYVRFLALLNELHTRIAVDWEDDEADFFWVNDCRDQIREVRLHDVVDKLRYSQLADRVARTLSKDGFNVVRKSIPDGNPHQVAVSSNMTRGVGLFDMKYLLTRCRSSGEAVLLGTQLQGRDFRLNIEMKPTRENQQLSRQIATALLSPALGRRIWFSFDSIRHSSPEYPKTRDFNQYSKIFWYRSKRLLGATAPSELVDLIARHARLIRDNHASICEQVVEFTR
jgi:hypothetical protein